jgi:hypothetical protein
VRREVRRGGRNRPAVGGRHRRDGELLRPGEFDHPYSRIKLANASRIILAIVGRAKLTSVWDESIVMAGVLLRSTKPVRTIHSGLKYFLSQWLTACLRKYIQPSHARWAVRPADSTALHCVALSFSRGDVQRARPWARRNGN